MIKTLVLVGFIGFLPVTVRAANNGVGNECQGNSCGTPNNPVSVEQAQGINAFNGNSTIVEAPDMKGMGSELAKHAASAGDVRSHSNPEISPCGDSSGLSGQVGVAGGGLATVTETCRAYRLEVLTKVSPDATSTKLARFTHFVGWLPRTLLHVASFGVLN